MTKKKHQTGVRLSARDLQIEVLKFLLAHPQKQFSARQLIPLLKVANNKDSVAYALEQLAAAGSVSEGDPGKYGAAIERLTRDEAAKDMPVQSSRTVKETPAKESPGVRGKETPSGREKAGPRAPKPGRGPTGRKIIEGRVDMTRTGAAYIVSELMDVDVYVAPKYINGALHGDIVKVLLFSEPPRRKGRTQRKPEGEILGVLKRANDFFIGTLRKSRRYATFLPDNLNMPIDLYVPLEACGEAVDGDKVIVKVTDWQEGKGRVPVARVTQVLGAVGGNDFEMKKILINAGFELAHSDEALAEAEAIPSTISPQEIARRRDFRDTLTFTIDPEDARDFDDALSIRKLDNGNLEIGVHIADVTHYLKPGTPLDQEAYRRSTSVYLVDRVNPMLPEKLSNHLCSLVPHEDRLTFSAVFEFDSANRIVRRWFGKTVIHSDKRFAYEEAQTLLDGKPTEGLLQLTLFEQLDWAVKTLDRIAKALRKEREKGGAINFDTEEVRFRLADDGTPLEAYVKERRDAHLLIEDFMLLANKEVAFYMEQKGQRGQEVPFVFRIHDLPDLEKVAEFSRFAAEMGVTMRVDTPKQIAQSYNKLMAAAKKDDRLKLLEPLAIRTMAKAVYSANNIGHYGLAFTHYTHFTSPIRRYSDVLAHRILERNLGGDLYRIDKSKLEEQCKHISLQEKKAADAERESVKYKQAEFMRSRIGEVFEGVISGFLDRGMFVEMPGSKAEGLVEFRTMEDTYVVDESNLRARGRRYGRDFRIGDRIHVRVAAVDLQKRQIELDFAEAP